MINNEKILGLRKKKNMKIEHLAVAFDSSITAIRNAETKPHHNPRISLLLKYAKSFSVPLHELVNFKDIKDIKVL